MSENDMWLTTVTRERPVAADTGDMPPAHLADPPYPPKKALCGASLRGIKLPWGGDICEDCQAVMNDRLTERLRSMFGPHIFN